MIEKDNGLFMGAQVTRPQPKTEEVCDEQIFSGLRDVNEEERSGIGH